jgi:hypothetical protein
LQYLVLYICQATSMVMLLRRLLLNWLFCFVPLVSCLNHLLLHRKCTLDFFFFWLAGLKPYYSVKMLTDNR